MKGTQTNFKIGTSSVKKIDFAVEYVYFAVNDATSAVMKAT